MCFDIANIEFTQSLKSTLSTLSESLNNFPKIFSLTLEQPYRSIYRKRIWFLRYFMQISLNSADIRCNPQIWLELCALVNKMIYFQ